MIRTMEEYLEKVEINENTTYTRHIRVHDSEGNKKYWNKLCKALDKDMKELDGLCDEVDRKSYVEWIENHKED